MQGHSKFAASETADPGQGGCLAGYALLLDSGEPKMASFVEELQRRLRVRFCALSTSVCLVNRTITAANWHHSSMVSAPWYVFREPRVFPAAARFSAFA